MRPATVPRLLTVVAVVTMVVAGIGFIIVLVLNAFVFDKYNAYGEVPIPGSGTLHLPAGEVTISFHTQILGGDGGLPIPDLRMSLEAPAGVPDPQVTESTGASTVVNNDARIRVWVARVAATGDYTISTDGNVGAFINPRLAFGHGSSWWQLPWWCAAVFGFGATELILARVWAARARRIPGPRSPEAPTVSYPPAPSYTPTEDGIRFEALKTLAALRDSGALTEKEFQTEKRRILKG